ncbi:SDR family NAD(P)-dependent oxidoreductase [Saccharicrinis sp. GN24d3]|uniref:SDR family NAD(P)-dependent oxidoreductase n=1 Tax=Saccharicrinis sp. GN24d3 TaxID=3458416 RepID=UPI00403623FD
MEKVALLTGASKGIGKTIAIQLARIGYHMLIVGRNRDQLLQTQSEVEKYPIKCSILEADLLTADAPLLIIREVIRVFGKLDVVINNAGVANALPIKETSVEIWDKIFSVNARAPFFICKEAIPYLKESPKPIIINIGSVVDFKGYVNQSVYASSKHALAGFTKVLAKEVQDDGILVHLISPGGVNTEMVREMRPDIDTNNLIQPEEIAELIEFLLTRKGKGTIDHLYIRRQSGLAFD